MTTYIVHYRCEIPLFVDAPNVQLAVDLAEAMAPQGVTRANVKQYYVEPLDSALREGDPIWLHYPTADELKRR